MQVQLEDPVQEVKRLQRCISDLVSLLALPAMWSGSEPSQSVRILSDALLRMLNLDFVYGRFKDPAGNGFLGTVRIADSIELKASPEEIESVVKDLFASDGQKSFAPVRNRFAGGDISMFPVPVGLQGEIGIIVAACDRKDFPGQTESLLLSVAANQLAIGIQEARLLNEQRRVANELDQRVAQRTAELAAANAQLQLQVELLQHLPVSAWTLRPDGTPDFVNQVWLEFSGQTLDFVRSHPEAWMTALHPEDREAASSTFWKGVRSGQGFSFETRSRARDGTYRWHLQQAVVLRDAQGKVLKFVGTTTDIDDQKRAEEALQASEASLAQAQYLSRTGSFSWKTTDDEIKWSEQLYRIFGFEPRTPVTIERINSRVHPDDVAPMIERVAVARTSGGVFEYEHRLLMPDGSVKYLIAMAQGNLNAEGELEYMGAVQDITQRRSSEDALAKARAELTNVARATSLGVLTASIAHEVNQPLSGIITNASTCLRMLSVDPPNIEGARETVRRTIRDGNRASDVITRLRTLYSKKEPALESMDLNEAVREVTALSSAEIQRNGVILRQEYADDLPPALGDRIQLQQVILNLLRNAADAMSTIDDRPRELLVRTEWDDENQVRLTVKDSGVGFAPHAEDKIFEAFYTTKADGMGMGLSISRSIIEAHQGRLWATRNNGPGSTFSFSIPCRLKEAA